MSRCVCGVARPRASAGGATSPERAAHASSNPSGPLLFLVRHRARRTPWGACSDDFGTQARTATRCDSPPPPAAHQQIASHTHSQREYTHRSLSLSLTRPLFVSLALDFSPTRTEPAPRRRGHPRIINGLNGTQKEMRGIERN